MILQTSSLSKSEVFLSLVFLFGLWDWPRRGFDYWTCTKVFSSHCTGRKLCQLQVSSWGKGLKTLSNRRTKLCSKFAFKSSQHPQHQHWFVPKKPGPYTRSVKVSYKPALCRLKRLKKSPIPYLTNLLNDRKWTISCYEHVNYDSGGNGNLHTAWLCL